MVKAEDQVLQLYDGQNIKFSYTEIILMQLNHQTTPDGWGVTTSHKRLFDGGLFWSLCFKKYKMLTEENAPKWLQKMNEMLIWDETHACTAPMITCWHITGLDANLLRANMQKIVLKKKN